MKQNKVYLGLIGGLGDVIYQYLHDPAWQSLADYKTKNPNAYVKAIVVSHNPLAHQIVELNPYIDAVEQHPPKREMRDKNWKHHEVIHQYAQGESRLIGSNLTHKRPVFYLKNSEVEFVNQLIIGKTAVVHPFASEEARVCIPPKNYRSIVDKLRYKGFNVIMLGGSYVKSFGEEEKYNKVEEFSYPKTDGFTNLIDKTNVRTSLALVTNADLFVGTWSCYGVTAWMHGIKSIICVPDKMSEGCYKIHNGKYKNHNKADKIIKESNSKMIVRLI